MIVVPVAVDEPIPDSLAQRTAPVPGVPCVFKGCRGYFHPGTRSVGVVLCAPWGYEDLLMRKSWRLLAEAIAGAGFPCLRFDYPGTGNSTGVMREITDVAQWTRSIGDAADFLRAYTGVKRFVFIGQSLGAALATAAASARSDVVALQLIAPVVKGRAYTRELAATTKMAADRVGITIGLEPGEGLNVLGFSMSAPLVDSLKALDLMRCARGGIEDVVVYDQADRKAGAEASEHFRRLGVAASFVTVDPYHLMVSDLQEIQPLPAGPEHIVAALAKRFPQVAPASVPRVPLLPATLRCEAYKEEPIRFGPARAMHGTLCLPARPDPEAPALVLLNRGLNPEIGWGRTGVDHARALAAVGVTTLRIDETGLGESPDRADRPQPLIYADAVAEDVSAAVDVLAARGHQRIGLVGVCSGAYTALLSGDLDPRVSDIVAVNPQRLVWNPAETVEDVMRYGLRSMDDYISDIRSRRALRKLAQSPHRLVPALRFLVRRAGGDLMKRLPLGLRLRLSRDSMAAKVIGRLSDLSRRGTRVSLVYSALDPGPLRELSLYFGRHGRNLRLPNIMVSIVPDADHNLTATRASSWLLDHLIDFAHAPPPGDRLTVPREPAGARARTHVMPARMQP